jgi:hypothetical protein
MDDHWLTYAPAREQLATFGETLAETLTYEDPWIAEVIGHLPHQGGKRLRPALLFVAAGFGKPRLAGTGPGETRPGDTGPEEAGTTQRRGHQPGPAIGKNWPPRSSTPGSTPAGLTTCRMCGRRSDDTGTVVRASRHR